MPGRRPGRTARATPQIAQRAGERPKRKRRLGALGAQAREYPQRARGLPGKHRLAELKYVEARAVGDARAHRLGGYLS